MAQRAAVQFRRTAAGYEIRVEQAPVGQITYGEPAELAGTGWTATWCWLLDVPACGIARRGFPSQRDAQSAARRLLEQHQPARQQEGA